VLAVGSAQANPSTGARGHFVVRAVANEDCDALVHGLAVLGERKETVLGRHDKPVSAAQREPTEQRTLPAKDQPVTLDAILVGLEIEIVVTGAGEIPARPVRFAAQYS
jgi:hypothetical protein